MSLTNKELNDLARSPRQTTTDEGSVQERGANEIILLDRYNRAVQNALCGPPFGLYVGRFRPMSTTGRDGSGH